MIDRVDGWVWDQNVHRLMRHLAHTVAYDFDDLDWGAVETGLGGSSRPSGATRTTSDATLMDALIAVQGTPEGLYGRRKMNRWLRRQGHQVAFCTTDRLMRDLGMNGVRRGKGVRTTVPAKDGNRAGDLLDRDFTAPAPNLRWVADFTYCRTWAGFVYVAFVVDVYAHRIVGWQAATTKVTDLVLTPLRIALWDETGKEHRWNQASCCTTASRGTDADHGRWFDHPLAGDPQLNVGLANEPDAHPVMVRVSGELDDVLVGRIDTLLAVFSDIREND